MKKIVGAISIAVLSSISTVVLLKNLDNNSLSFQGQHTNNQVITPVSYTRAIPEATVNFTAAAEQSVNAVVHIQTKTKRQNLYSDPIQQFFFGDPFGGRSVPQIQQGSGSGVIVSSDGYIATNNHVIEGADEIEVILNNKRTLNAEVIGTDPSTDLALLKIKDNNLPYLLYGNSDDVKVGEWVLAVGNPFNLTSTVTAGIVSAKGRNINIIGSNQNSKIFPIESFIQTDAAVNPGNSGGALVNTQGQLIGINSAIASNTGSYAGYSFAIPVSIVKKVMDDLLEYGEVQRALLGVSMREVDNKLAEDKGLKDIKGVYVGGVMEGGAADEAGIKDGDIILKVNEASVNSAADIQEHIGRQRPGDKVMLTLIRAGKEKVLPVVLKNKNGTTNVVKTNKTEIIDVLGASFEELSSDDKRSLRIDNGLRISKLSSGKLKNAGIKEGFVITSIDKKPVEKIDDLNVALRNKKGGTLIEGVYPNGLRAYYGLGM